MKGRIFSDKEITEGIKNDNNEVLKYLYENIKPDIVEYFENNDGTKSDADDIFQVVLIKIRTDLKKSKIIAGGNRGKLWLKVYRKCSSNFFTRIQNKEEQNI